MRQDILVEGVWNDGSVVNSTYCSHVGPGFNSQPPVNPFQEARYHPSSDLSRRKQDIYIHKKIKYKNDKVRGPVASLVSSSFFPKKAE